MNVYSISFGSEHLFILIFLKINIKKKLQITLKVYSISFGFEHLFMLIFLKNWHKKTSKLLWRFLRHRADSNRSRSFCRAQPSHSATTPLLNGWQKYLKSLMFKSLNFNIFKKRFFLTLYKYFNFKKLSFF